MTCGWCIDKDERSSFFVFCDDAVAGVLLYCIPNLVNVRMKQIIIIIIIIIISLNDANVIASVERIRVDFKHARSLDHDSFNFATAPAAYAASLHIPRVVNSVVSSRVSSAKSVSALVFHCVRCNLSERLT